MAYNATCALCLTTDAQWFMEVFDETNRTLDMALIISKHLWFDLKPAAQPCICGDCWTSIHDFHLFYTKLESIHSDEIHAVNSSEQQTTELEVQEPQHHEEHLQEKIVDEQEDRSSKIIETGVKMIPSIASTNVVLQYHATETSDTMTTSEKKHFVEVEDYDSNDNEDDCEAYCPSDDNMLDHDTLNSDSKEKILAGMSKRSNVPMVTVVPAEQPAKRGRGRPPKQKVELRNEALSITETIIDSCASEPPVKRPRGRPPKRKQDTLNKELKVEEPQAIIHTPVPAINEPIKRRRGRPPKNSFAADPIQSIAAVHANGKIKIEKDSQSPSEEQHTKASRKVIRGQKLNEESENELDNESDYEVRKQRPVKREKSDRDERIFKYVDEFCCHYCVENVSFKRFIDADRHYKLVHNEPGFLKCTKCDKKCFTPGMFVSHMETHEDPEKNKCNICGKITDCNISLKKHMRVHLSQLEENLPFPCSRCKRKFETEELRNKHEKLHVPKPLVKREKGPDLELLAFYKRIYCDVCEKQCPESTSFENFWDLRVHMEQEHNKGAYLKCPICNKRNLYRQHLITHIDMHNNPEKYRCEVCKEVYQNLDSHMIKAHTPTTAIPADKKYKCEQCGRMFNFLANLKMHLDCVHGSKDVRCNVCNKYFNLKAFQVHKRTAHTDQMLMCEHCPKMFKTRGALEAHKATHDDSLVQFTTCKLCNKQIKNSNVKKHMTSQHSEDGPVSCELCGKTFRTMFHMKRHQKNTCEATIDSRKHKCEVCGKGFCLKLTMIEHMTTHTRTNKYQCAFCFKSFGYISNLYKHRKKAHPLEWQEILARPEEGIASVIMLIPANEPHICMDCWTTIHNFHRYYTKLEDIHGCFSDDCIKTDETTTDYGIEELENIEFLEEDAEELRMQMKHLNDDSSLYEIGEHGNPKTNNSQEQRTSSSAFWNKEEIKVLEIEVEDDERGGMIYRLDGFQDDATDGTAKSEILRGPVILNGQMKMNPATESSTIDIDVLAAEQQPVKRGRGRPRKHPKPDLQLPIQSVKQEHNSSIDENNTSMDSTGNDEEVPVKRRRGRPPKNANAQQTASPVESTPQYIKKEIKTESQDEESSDAQHNARAERRSTRRRKPKHYSDMEQGSELDEEESAEGEEQNEYQPGDDPEYDARLELQKSLNMDDFAFYEYQCNMESEQAARDNKIFQYVDEFVCHICMEKVTFKKFAEAHLHYRVEHNQPPFLKCPKCEKKCHTPGMFVSHMETHDDPEKNKCQICGKYTDCNISLKKHMRVHQSELEENLPFPCSLCKRKFQTEDLRAKHEKLHVPKPYVPKEKGPDQEVLDFYKVIVCDVCEEEQVGSPTYDNLSDLRTHMVKVHNKNMYVRCPVCLTRQVNRQQIITHIDMHNNPDKYRCEVCKEVYQNLHQHMMKAHAANTAEPAEKQHKCDQCGRMFNFLANLKMHIDCVHGVKDVRCNICDKYFNYRAYKTHKRTAHTDLMLMCELCPKMFKNRKAFEAHKASHDGILLRMTNSAGNARRHQQHSHHWLAWISAAFLLETRHTSIMPCLDVRSNECSICQHNIIGPQRLEAMCGHTFHRHCLALWMRTYAFCPDCPRRM
uniref:Transcription factor grauzone n=1 Tax=Anopheles epiroticus TaxID=199890 RepID=A0A182PH55_9DIPT